MPHEAFQIIQYVMGAMDLLALTAALVFALAKIGSVGRPAVLVAVGVGVFLLGRLFGIAMSLIISRWASQQENVLIYVLLQSAVLEILHVVGIVLLIAAAFSSRRAKRSEAPAGGPLAQPENPYSV